MIKRGILLVCLLASVQAAGAFTVVFEPGSTTVVSSIEGLTINEAGFTGIYNVIFTGEAIDDVRADGGHPIYDLAISESERAAIADGVVTLIVDALNTTEASRVGTLAFNSGVGYLPYADGSVSGSILADRARYLGITGPWENSTPGSISSVTNGFVTISLVPVPLPAGLPLLLTALSGLGLVARRTRKAS